MTPRREVRLSNDVITILIIDDSETDRYLYRRYLELSALRYEVYEAENGERGLALANELNPDCILLDLKLGHESGYEVLSHLIGLVRPPQRTVLIFTELGRDLLQEGALALGAAGFLVKGRTDAAALDLAIQQAIGRASSQ